MRKKLIFTTSEKRVISVMYQLDRWATANEISDWADMSWNTANLALKRLKLRGVVSMRTIKGKKYWVIK